MRVMVIGGTGFVGPHIIRRLVAGGHVVLALHRGQTEADLDAERGRNEFSQLYWLPIVPPIFLPCPFLRRF
jgi:nucleoside-diphosphate-sugar epimerase